MFSLAELRVLVLLFAAVSCGSSARQTEAESPRVAASEPAEKSDRDGDGVFGDVDQCPGEEEDKDGFEDEDGCPDVDNDPQLALDPDADSDNDGIPDADDHCPNRPEVYNGCKDEDGCPDVGSWRCPSPLCHEPLKIMSRVFFSRNRAVLSKTSQSRLLELRESLEEPMRGTPHSAPDIGRLEITGFRARNERKNSSLSRAKAVFNRLVVLGFEKDRLVVVGWRSQRKVPQSKAK